MDTLDFRISHPLRSFRLDVALEVGHEPVALVGPSGAGKTTVLRALSGLLTPEHGRVALGGDVWLDSALRIRLRPEERPVGFVFQDYALFPHLTVRQNVAYAGRGDIEPLLGRLGLTALGDERPDQISGGERQRVAVARALAARPALLVADEPTARLDEENARAVGALFAELARETGTAIVCATHDPALIEHASAELPLASLAA
jgi:ABC-type sulfate/molybdate transport systems ATPase subunit